MRRVWMLCGVLAAAVLFLSAISQPEQSLSMLDVGQGDSFLYQRGAIQVLVDGGPGADVLTRLGEEMPWHDRDIELVVATHFDRDHIEGLTHVLNQYGVKMVLIPRHAAASTDLKRQFLRMLEEKGIPYRFAWYGQKITTAGFALRIMWPIPGPEWERISRTQANNASIVMRAEMIPQSPDAPPLSFLFTGDAEGPVERQMLAAIVPEAFDVDVLKVGHHGSKTSTSQALVTAVSPAAALISAGEDNSYGHPTELILGRLREVPVFRTDQDGTVRFTRAGDSWVVSCRGKTDLRFWQELCIKNK